MTLLTRPPGIVLSNASLRFQHKLLFENLSLELSANSITCLLGPSGVGKTSLLRILAGLPVFGRDQDKLQSFPHSQKKETIGVCNTPTQSILHDLDNEYCQATITTSDGQPLNGRITYMGQTDLLLPWLSVLDNVMLGSYLRSQTPCIRTKQRALAILESVGLIKELHHKPGTLSGGMKQRAALARTLMEDKPIILMDEPFSALDAITRYDMQSLAAEKLINKTVLLITHDPWEALRLGNKILVLRGQPATFSQPIIPPELPPRDITQTEFLSLQKLLLNELQMVECK